MKKITIALLLLAVSCATKHIAPLPAGYETDNLFDVCIPAEFTPEEFNWADSTITMTVYSEDLYDMVDIHELAVGDTLVYMGEEIVVKNIVRSDSCLDINGGIGENEGATLAPSEGGTWRGMQFDNHSTYSMLGKVTLPFSSRLVIIDCGNDYKDPYDTIRMGQREYLESSECSNVFCNLNTQVLVENGTVTSITRRWIP